MKGRVMWAAAALGMMGLAWAAEEGAGAGTKGRTSGGEGQAHCCGMKGLGGANVEVLCSPGTVALGKPFTVNVKYMTDVHRPVDIHVDLLNADTKSFYTGATIPMDYQQGQLSVNLTMADQAAEPFLWKVFVAPRGEPFPNMLAETGFVAHLTDNVENNCPQIPTEGSTAKKQERVNHVILKDPPKTLIPGQPAKVTLEYDLVTDPTATLSVALMNKNTDLHIASNVTEVEDKGEAGDTSIDLPVPDDVTRDDPVYIVVTMTPTGKTWEDRLAEDRTYNSAVVKDGAAESEAVAPAAAEETESPKGEEDSKEGLRSHVMQQVTDMSGQVQDLFGPVAPQHHRRRSLRA